MRRSVEEVEKRTKLICRQIPYVKELFSQLSKRMWFGSVKKQVIFLTKQAAPKRCDATPRLSAQLRQMPIHPYSQSAAVLVTEPTWKGQNLTFWAICWLCSLRRCP